MTAITVRGARPDEIETVAALADQCWQAAYEGMLAPETIDAAVEEWYDPDRLRESLDREDVVLYVAVDDEIVGYLRGGLDEEVAHLGAIYAHPQRLGEGIGSRLLARFERFCAERGYETIELAVLADNEVGQSFYRSRGYEPVEDREVVLFGETVADRVFRGSTA